MISADEAVRAALPAGCVTDDHDFGMAVFNLARHLKAVLDLSERPTAELKLLVQQWYEAARGHLPGRTFTDVWAQFVTVRPTVRFAAGDDPVQVAWEIVQRQPPPPEADNYENPKIGEFIALCRQIQRERGDGQFFLSGHVAGKLLGVSQPTVRTWFKMLEVDGILEVIDAGGGIRNGKRQAGTYRCRPGPWEQPQS